MVFRNQLKRNLQGFVMSQGLCGDMPIYHYSILFLYFYISFCISVALQWSVIMEAAGSISWSSELQHIHLDSIFLLLLLFFFLQGWEMVRQGRNVWCNYAKDIKHQKFSSCMIVSIHRYLLCSFSSKSDAAAYIINIFEYYSQPKYWRKKERHF